MLVFALLFIHVILFALLRVAKKIVESEEVSRFTLLQFCGLCAATAIWSVAVLHTLLFRSIVIP